MSTRTHFLSLLVLVCTAFPAQLFALRARAATAPAVRAATGSGGTAALAALAWYLAPTSGVFAVPATWYWCAVAVVLGYAAPVIEIGVGALSGALSGRRLVLAGTHRGWSGASAPAALSVLAVAIAEEVIFRGVGQHLLEFVFGWPAAPAIGLIALGYGLNHLYFGWLTVGQKFVTGLLLGALYDMSGRSVLVPALAHLVQNLLVVLVLPRSQAAG